MQSYANAVLFRLYDDEVNVTFAQPDEMMCSRLNASVTK